MSYDASMQRGARDAQYTAANPTTNLSRRLEFMQLDAESCQSIRSLKTVVERELPIALDKFYQQLRKTPEASRFFSSEEQITRAKGAQTGHWANISRGDFNEDYMSKVRIIGTVHARIGLEPQWYIGGYSLILEHLITALFAEFAPKGGIFARSAMTQTAFAKALSSLVKAVLLDMDLAISVYIDEAEVAKKKAQAEAIDQERQLVCSAFSTAMASIAEKDLGCSVSEDLPEAYLPLSRNFNQAIGGLAETIDTIGVGTRQINNSTLEIRTAADQLARRTEQQAASLEETAAALEEITTTVHDATHRAEEAGLLVAKAKAGAEKSGDVVRQAVAAMTAIEKSATEISNITGVIDEIAFQTNLLALNAGVEAARAGDAGKGFAVVAQEVRELAQRTAAAAKEINNLIATSGQQVQSGVALVHQTGVSLTTIAEEVSEIDKHISSIVRSAHEQSGALKEINRAVNNLDQGTQQNAAMVEESTAATHALGKEITRIADMLGEFRTGDARDASGRTREAPTRLSHAGR